ncbi:hypothetical protein G647_08163 [Cladophialophora carrionii CBS 160.54]|uniref:Uncharacterized protein n=1 Tax=Cladophialophora carrionii CBS 160.54 TaxID=1279043 RepID=V9CZP2_9EURO|nr:uncharacterized protein G647_08163 [Cladophialophora carrionii CBS 160.54]ETI20129.1 hypothetical protein G647_08163 [Cladophialophora carrionii CBS 160.54]
MPDPMDPESSDSDVSVGGGDEYRLASPLTAPIPLPPPASKHALESPDAVQARLDELQRVEDHNVKKYDLLRAKRSRKDEKIRRRREFQDQKWAAIIEARRRRDARIEARRRREDAAFSQFDHELEEEEGNLRRRLKRLKRGLPPDESPKPGGRSISSSSMSPPGPALSTLPPPPKRHQVGPPGQPDAINPSQSRPSPQPSFPISTKGPLPPPAPAPSYSFARDYSSSYPRPYHHSSYSTTPTNASPTVANNGPGHLPQPSSDRIQFSHLGRPASPLSRAFPSTVPSNQSPVTPAVNPNPPRQIYDTRPPPPTTASSGFASVNAPPPPPPASGFATINARTTDTPPASHVPLTRPPNDGDGNRTPSQTNNVMENNRFHPYPGAMGSAAVTPTSGTSTKRTPSTTHPYQMSEAFANRHHHCERVDGLNRGIWTSYGIGGTADNPTGPAVEMYLRCNHDGCARIDWRTVHGLQCHIVKNHEQPKGTIGSLEKALERYGVPVREVEDFEREHGKGAAGTMADPKNLKMKLKTKIQDFSRRGTPGPYGVDPDARPAGYRPSPTATDDSPTMSDGVKKSPDTATTNGHYTGASTDGAGRPTAPQTASTPPANGFTAIRPSWMGVTTPLAMAAKVEPEPKSLQGDFGTSAAAKDEQAQGPQTGVTNGGNFSTPPTTVATTSPRPEGPATATTDGTVSAVTNPNPPVPVAAPEQVTPLDEPQARPANDEDKKEFGDPPPIQEPVQPKTKDGDVEMNGVDEHSEEKEEKNGLNGEVKTEDKSEAGKVAQPEENPESRPDTIEIDMNAGKDTSGPTTRRSVMQSPSITTRSLAATTPGSGRRPSRRSSAARKSVDVEGDAGKAAPTSEDGDKDDKDSKEEKTEKQEPRRSLTGRVLRRGTRY